MRETGAARLFAHAQWRRHWAALVFVALVVAVGGGLTMAAAAGARRADSAFDRFLAATHTSNIEVRAEALEDPAVAAGLFDTADDLLKIPGVQTVRQISFVAAGIERDGGLDLFSAGLGATFGDGRATYMVVDGRDADPVRSDELLVNETLARIGRLRPGDRVAVRTLAPDQVDVWVGQSEDPPRGPRIDMTVVGVARMAEDISDTPGPLSIMQAGFLQTYGPSILQCACQLSIHADPERVDEVA
ncbi:MAG TPA: hypothetical protein VF855_08145, partial [Acidimicrobiales bacterium]